MQLQHEFYINKSKPVKKEVIEHSNIIANMSKDIVGQIDLESILEDMLETTSQLSYHLSLK